MKPNCRSKKPVTLKVKRLLDFQTDLKTFVNKRVKVFRYFEKYHYDFYIFLKDPKGKFYSNNRIIFYGGNF